MAFNHYFYSLQNIDRSAECLSEREREREGQGQRDGRSSGERLLFGVPWHLQHSLSSQLLPLVLRCLSSSSLFDCLQNLRNSFFLSLFFFSPIAGIASIENWKMNTTKTLFGNLITKISLLFCFFSIFSAAKTDAYAINGILTLNSSVILLNCLRCV